MPTIVQNTPFGAISITEQDGAITRVTWGRPAEGEATPLLQEAARQMAAYAEGRLQEFDLPLRVEAAPFQQAVCEQIAAIPFGETRTYGQIAKSLGVSAQAVGSACGGNPIPVFIPCHRVMGANGKLTGFSGGTGVETKVALLRHEGAAGLLI